MMIDTRDGAVMRLRPRANLEVNRHFMCDVGRADYRWMNRGDRAEVPLQRDGSRLLPTDWDSATERLAVLVGGSARVVLLASGRASLESLSWLRRLADGRPVTAAIKVPLGEEAPLPGIPDLALRKERVPNLDGARLAGYDSSWEAALAHVDATALVVVLDAELDDSEVARLAGAGALVALTTLDDERLKGAALVLPVTNLAEENGSYVNRAGRIQRYNQAKSAPGMARPAWWIAAEAWAAGDPDRIAPGTAAEAFARLGETLPGLEGASYADLGLTGLVLAGAQAPEGVAR
jgi:NADH-quinone oxidoreductase subunit G